MHPVDKLGRTSKRVHGDYTRRCVNRGIVRQHNGAQQIWPTFVLITYQFGDHIVHTKVHPFTLRVCLRSVGGSLEMDHSQSLVEQLYNFP